MRLCARLAASMLVCAALAGCSSGTGVLDAGLNDGQLHVSNWGRDRWLNGKDGPWELPAGLYRVRSVRFDRRDTDGSGWGTHTGRDLGDIAKFRIRDGQTTRLAVGPPFTVHTKARRRGDDVLLSMSLTGRSGEGYRPPFAAGRLGGPAFTIEDGAGTVLLQDAFKYG